MVATGAHEHALVVGADVMSSIIDYTDRRPACCSATAPGWRSSGSPPDDPSGRQIIDFDARDRRQRRSGAVHAGRRQPAARVARDRRQRLHYVKQDGQAVFKFAVRKTRRSAGACSSATAHAARRRPVRLAPGQPPHHQSAAERLGLPPRTR
jgi:3-oxoacyl-[acyl-carrier-protein] synthase III